MKIFLCFQIFFDNYRIIVLNNRGTNKTYTQERSDQLMNEK